MPALGEVRRSWPRSSGACPAGGGRRGRSSGSAHGSLKSYVRDNGAARGPARPEESAAPLRIVFVFMTLFARLRLFGSVIEGLLDRGHSVHVLIEDDSEHGEVEEAWLRRMESRPGFSLEVTARAALRPLVLAGGQPPPGIGVRPLAPARVRREAVVQGPRAAARAGLGEDAAEAGGRCGGPRVDRRGRVRRCGRSSGRCRSAATCARRSSELRPDLLLALPRPQHRLARPAST